MKWVGAIVLVAGAVGAGVVVRGGKGGEDIELPTVAVGRADLVDRALAVGEIEPEVEVSVKSKVSGVVRKRFAEVGDYVRAGDPLLEIRPDPTPLERVEARRQVELREIESENTLRELERQRSLVDQGLVSRQEFEATERRHAEASLQLQIARERLDLLEKGQVTMSDRRIETVVVSPIDGYILEKMVEIGDPVVPLSSYMEGTVLMTMADMDALVFRGTVDEIDVGRLTEGMPVKVTIGALPEARVEGVLERVSLKARKEENATTFPIEIRLTETHGSILRAGYSANAEIVIDQRDSTLAVPERLVTFEEDDAWVTVRLEDGTSERRSVQTGLSDAIQVEILEGLVEGEHVQEKPRKTIG